MQPSELAEDDTVGVAWTFGRLAGLSVELGEALTPIADPEQSAFVLADFCLRHIGNADAATLLRRSGPTVDTMFATDLDGRSADRLQLHLGHGPGIDALHAKRAQRCADLSTSVRWPRFGPQAVSSFGWRAMLAVPLPDQPDGRDLVITLYSRQPDALTDLDKSAMCALVAQGGLKVVAARYSDQAAHLRQALTSNRDIGTAIGILMASRLLTREQAFQVLRSASQNGHRKLSDVAQEVVETGTLDLA